MLHYAYSAIKKSMEAYVTRAGGKVIEVPLPFVDAAHSIGCTDVDMHKIGVDCYTIICTSGFFCPPLIAFLYSRKNPFNCTSSFVIIIVCCYKILI